VNLIGSVGGRGGPTNPGVSPDGGFDPGGGFVGVNLAGIVFSGSGT
jgi:hypothetical protein